MKRMQGMLHAEQLTTHSVAENQIRREWHKQNGRIQRN